MENLSRALVAARADIHNPPFDGKNPHFGNEFASLKACFEATLPVFADHGIAVVQEFETVDGGCVCITHLIHESGEQLALKSPSMTPTKTDPQGWASASTYARRYGIMAAAGIVGDPDDDGNAASGSAFQSKQAKTKIRKGLLDFAKDSDHEHAREQWDSMDNDQRAELWASYGKDDQRIIQESLDQTKPKK